MSSQLGLPLLLTRRAIAQLARRPIVEGVPVLVGEYRSFEFRHDDLETRRHRYLLVFLLRLRAARRTGREGRADKRHRQHCKQSALHA